MILHGRQQEVIRLTAAMLQQGWRSAACSVSQSACLTGVQAQEIGLVACAGKHWRCWCMAGLLVDGRAAGAWQGCWCMAGAAGAWQGLLVRAAPPPAAQLSLPAISWQPVRADFIKSPLAWTALSCLFGCHPTSPFMCSLHHGQAKLLPLFIWQPVTCTISQSTLRVVPYAHQTLQCGTATLCSHSCTWGLSS